MRRSTLVMCALLAVATFGCDKIKGFFTKKPVSTTPTVAAADSARRDSLARAQAMQQTAQRPAPPPPSVARPVQDTPYSSPDTGTIAPGMAERDIYSLWGAPMEVRRLGEMTYIYYPNGCERTCGTADVVILQNGVVIDAILRWAGHGYSGQSSSPPGRTPEATKP